MRSVALVIFTALIVLASPEWIAQEASASPSAPSAASESVQAHIAAVPANTRSKVPQAQAQSALNFQNARRAEVGAPALQWSSSLAAEAQIWANHLAGENQCKLEHNPNNSHGENLFEGSNSSYTALSAAQGWYNEIKQYTYGALTPSNWQATGHYTQMVWSSTKQIGMGQAACSGGGIVIVAEYDPPGNVMGQKPY